MEHMVQRSSAQADQSLGSTWLAGYQFCAGLHVHCQKDDFELPRYQYLELAEAEFNLEGIDNQILDLAGRWGLKGYVIGYF